MRFLRLEGGLGRGDLAGAAHLELVSGVVPLRPEDAMCEAMLSGLMLGDTRTASVVRRVHQRVPVELDANKERLGHVTTGDTRPGRENWVYGRAGRAMPAVRWTGCGCE